MDEQDTPEAPEWWKWVLWLWHHLRINRNDFMRGPVLAALVLVAAVSYWLAGHQDKERLDLATDRVNFLDDQLSAYRDRLQGATPDQAAKQLASLNTRVVELNKVIDDMRRIKTKSPLTESQKLKLREETINYSKAGVPWQDVYVGASNDETSYNFESNLLDIFGESHLNLIAAGFSFVRSNEKGIVLYLIDPQHPTKQAEAFMDMLRGADIPFMVGLPWVPKGAWIPFSAVGFQIFICPDS